MNHMFCFQCQQTAGCSGCIGNAGVCGKKSSTAQLQDQLTGALIGLASTFDQVPATSETTKLILEGIFATITNVNFDDDSILVLIDRIHKQKDMLLSNCQDCTSPRSEERRVGKEYRSR